ncbi:MAG: type II secretion system F family protein [Planctomycetes bacterium]|nr:type II secretion system F family protein [Planctomycetota bacterium]
MELFIYFFTFLSVGFLAYAFTSKKGPVNDEDVIDAEDASSPLKKTISALPSLAGAINSKVIQNKDDTNHPYIRIRNSLDRLLLQAGSPNNLTSDDTINLSFYGMLLSAALMYFYAWSFEMPVVVFVYCGGMFGLALPYMLISLAATKRLNLIRKELPYLLDLLTLCVEAGMDFSTALIRIVPTFKATPLGDEVSLLVTEMRMGKSRQDSLRDFSQRVSLLELSTVVNSIIQSDKLGVSMGPVLRIQSEDMRKHRALLAEEEGMKAPVKLLFPLVAFIFPTTFVVIFAPMVIKMML